MVLSSKHTVLVERLVVKVYMRPLNNFYKDFCVMYRVHTMHGYLLLFCSKKERPGQSSGHW